MQQRDTTADDPTRLAGTWYEQYYRETLADDGDPEALISNFRELSERALPQSPTHKAFALFLERIRAADIDLEPDDFDDAEEAL